MRIHLKTYMLISCDVTLYACRQSISAYRWALSVFCLTRINYEAVNPRTKHRPGMNSKLVQWIFSCIASNCSQPWQYHISTLRADHQSFCSSCSRWYGRSLVLCVVSNLTIYNQLLSQIIKCQQFGIFCAQGGAGCRMEAGCSTKFCRENCRPPVYSRCFRIHKKHATAIGLRTCDDSPDSQYMHGTVTFPLSQFDHMDLYENKMAAQ